MRCVLTIAVTIVFMTGAFGCGKEASKSEQADATTSTARTQTDRSEPAASEVGVGPIKEVNLADLTEEMADRGENVFDMKCAVCHKLDERYVGPSLRDVTKRRSPEWIMNMILNPEGMTKEDPVARKMFTEYLTQMTFQNVTEEDAKAILAYFLSVEGESSDPEEMEDEE